MKKHTGSLLSRMRTSLSTQIKNNEPDINEQLRSLKESQVRITFSDIWRDYTFYRKAYYQGQVRRPPAEVYKEQQVKVDVEKFSYIEYLKFVFKHGHDLEINNPTYLLSKALVMTLILVGGYIAYTP